MEAPTWVNLAIICLNEKFGKCISTKLSKELDMFFVDCKELVAYDLIDSQAMLEHCGIEYLQEREFAAVRRCANFENTVIFLEYDLFKNNRDAFQEKTLLCYVKLPKELLSNKDPIQTIAFESRHQYLMQECELVIDLHSLQQTTATKLICQKIGELI